jgi:hypothetical protein
LVLSGGHGAGGTDLVSFGSGDTQSGLGWSGSLPAPVLSGTRATYPEVKPGVDVVVEATGTGFEQYVVVKNRAGLAQMATLAMPLRTGAAGVDQVGDGSLRLRDGKGAVASRVPAPVMWDASVGADSGEHLRSSVVPSSTVRDAKSGATSLVMTPDAGFLADPGLAFPVTIDPGINGGPQIGFDTFVQTGYNSDQSGSTELKLGYSNDGGSWTARSYLSFPGGTFYGAKIYTAKLHLYEWHAWSCPAAGGDHGWQAQLTNGADTNTRWTSQPDWTWYPQTLSNSSETLGASGCGEGWVSIDVMPSFNVIAGNWFGTATMGLRGHSESDHNGWKRFYSMNAAANHPYFEVTYDHVPTVSGVTVEGLSQCGSGAGARQYLATAKPTFTATLGDSDPGQNLTGAVEILQNGAVVQTVPSQQPVAPGQKARFVVTTPLTSGVYTFRVHSNDGTENSPNTGLCEIQVDTDPPRAAPAITPVAVPAGTPTGITVKADPTDAARVAGYVYGFDPDRLVNTVNAGTDLSAVIPVTVASADTPTLYVGAVNHTGAHGPLATFDIWPSGNDPTPTRTRNDFNGDGRADLIGTTDLGGGRTELYDLTSQPGGGAYNPVALLDEPSAFSAGTIRTVTGDFNGDGRTDTAILKQQVDGSLWLYLWRSDGNFTANTVAWTSVGTGATWSLASMKTGVGDFNVDGKDDIVAMYDDGSSTWEYRVLLAQADGSGGVFFTYGGAPWYKTPVGVSNWANIKIVVGNFDGTPGADITEFYDYPNCQTRLFFHKNNGNGTFADGIVQWDSGAANWCSSRTNFVAGDFNGDGKDDIAATYDYDGCSTGLWYRYALADGTGFGSGWLIAWQSPGSSWCAGNIELSAGNVDGDANHRDDVMVMYHAGGLDQARDWAFMSTGSNFSAPALQWEGAIGPPGIGSVSIDETATYQLVARHSNKCLTVPGGGNANGTQLTQQTCSGRGMLNQQFRVVHNGAAQYLLQPAQVIGKCVDILGPNSNIGTAIHQWNCYSGVSQIWSLYYASGMTDIVVRGLSIYDGKCMDVAAQSQADGALLQQWDCNGQANQDFYLRKITPDPWSPTPKLTMSASGGTKLVDSTGYGGDMYLSGGPSVGNGYLTLNGSGSAATLGPVIDPSRGFTVAGWVRARGAPDGWGTAISADSVRTSPFGLGLHGTTWSMWQHLSDSDSTAFTAAESAAGTAVLNTWTHLAGVYDPVALTLKLYVNGALVATTPATALWSGAGALVVGRHQWGGAGTGYLTGDLDEVLAYARPLSDSSVAAMYAGGPVALKWPINETSGTVLHDSGSGHLDGTIGGGATLVAGNSPTDTTDRALHLNGTTGYAKTAVPVLHTDHSFSVSAWVRLTATGSAGAQCIVSEDGQRTGEFMLQYSGGTNNRWEFAIAGSDVDAPTIVTAYSASPAVAGQWVHLVATYDAPSGQLRLYVNGVPQPATATATSANRFDAAAAPGSAVEVGRHLWAGAMNNYFDGDVDDVQLYAYPLSAPQIAALSTTP